MDDALTDDQTKGEDLSASAGEPVSERACSGPDASVNLRDLCSVGNVIKPGVVFRSSQVIFQGDAVRLGIRVSAVWLWKNLSQLPWPPVCAQGIVAREPRQGLSGAWGSIPRIPTCSCPCNMPHSPPRRRCWISGRRRCCVEPTP